jgi:adenylate kinase
MNIFVAGIHGVGKTYLAKRLPAGSRLMHTSASTLIKEERALPDWNADKRVADVDANQVALAQAVARYNAGNTALLLDGHFVLLGQDGQFIPLGVDVFKALNLHAVVLIEAPPNVVAERVTQRDELYRDTMWLANFMQRERAQAALVCTELNLPLAVLTSPSDVEFANAVCSNRS